MSFTGYRIYRGFGGLGSVDWTTPVATAPAGATSVQVVGLGHAAGAAYTYVLRPVLADLETADVSCAVGMTLNDAGDWPGDRPRAVRALSATVEAAGQIRLRWRAAPEGPPADEYAIFAGPSPRVDTSVAASAVIPAEGVDHATELTCADGQTVYVAVVARTVAGLASPAVTIGPIVGDAAEPAAPTAYVDTAF